VNGTRLSERRFGIYEKALRPAKWPEMLDDARSAGYDFVEMSIDESDERLARLKWSTAERRKLASACEEAGVPIYSICLSGHRRHGLGSADPAVRHRADRMLDQASGLAADLGIRLIQIAGYHAYYEPSDPLARMRYVAGLQAGLALAAQRGVMLAIENIDTVDTASAEDVLALVDEINSPWFQIYPDVGNFAVHGLDVPGNVGKVAPHAVGMHLKDARPGQPRRVAFGQGSVPWGRVFGVLGRSGYLGPLTVEMWNDDPDTATAQAADALTWIKARLVIQDEKRIPA
jgi:predicted hexulose-6-phosphate isomerase